MAFAVDIGRPVATVLLVALAIAPRAASAGPEAPRTAPPGCFFSVHGDIVCPPPPPEMPARLHPGAIQATTLPLPAGATRGGKVGLVVDLDVQGKVLDVSVERSSRERALDRAAMAHAWTLRYSAAADGGRAIASRLRVEVAFDPALPAR
jgi:protein TonB